MSLFKKFFVYSVVVTTTLWSLGLPMAKAAGSYPAGSLLALQGQSGAAVYVVNADGTKSVFPDSKTYMTWFSNFDKVVRVPVSELDMYPDKGAVTYRPGTKLVTHANTAKVFAVEPGGVLRWVPSEAVAVSLYGANWATRVQDVIPGYFSSSYSSTGSDLSTMYPTGSLVKMGTTTYYIDGTTKRPFANDAALTANNFRTEFVINATSLSGYSDGSSITGAESALTAITGTGSVVVIPSGGLSIALNAGTPAYNGATLCGGDGFLFSKFNFSATSGDVVVTGMKVKRSSVGSYKDLDKVWVVVDGARRGAVKSVNSADEASLLFSADSQKITVANGTTKTVELWASLPATNGTDTCLSGNYNALGITEVTTASTVNGLPVTGYAQAVLTAAAPDMTISQGSIGDTAAIGDTAVEVAKFKLLNQESNETLVFKGISLKSVAPASGTKVANDDFINFKLLDNSNNVVAGPVAMSNDGYVRFNLNTPFSIAAGTNKYEWFTVTADAVAGPEHKITLDLEDPSDLNVYGGTNMFHSAVSDSYTAEEVALGNADLVVAVDSATNPIARDVSENSTVVLLNAKFTAANGPVSATGMDVLLEGADMDTDSPQEFDNLRVYVNNVLVSEATGTALGNTDGDTTQTISFTDDFSVTGVVPVRVEIDTKDLQGTTLTTIRATISNLAGTTRDSDGAAITESGTAVGNYATLVTPGYTIYRSATPVSISKVLGSQNVDFLGLDIKSNNTTNVVVNKLKVRLVGNGFTAHQNDVQNVKLVDVNGNLISGPKSLNSSKEAEFTGLNLTATSNGTKVIVRGDMNSTMNDSGNVTYDTDDLYFVVVSSEATANNNTYSAKDSGGDTIDGTAGNEVNVTSGRIDITVSQTGTLTATLSSDTAVSAQLLAGSTNNAIAQYKLVADKENVQVKKFRVGLTTGAAGEDEISRIALYDGATLLAETNSFSGAYTEFDITSKNFWVMSGTGNAKYLTVKVDLTSTTNTVLDSGATVAAVLIDMETWGSVNEVAPASGATADGFAFAAADDLDEDLDASETEITLVDTTGILAGDIIKIGSEQIYVTTVASATSLDPVVRGFNGTTAAAHTDADLADDTTVAKSIEGNNFKAYGNKLTIANGTLSGGTLSEWGTYTDAFKFKLTPSASATEEAVLNSVKVSLNTATGISAANSTGWYITAVALYNGAGTQLATSAVDIVAASGDVTFSSLAEPIATSGEEFTVKVQVALGSGGGVIESGDKLAMAIESLGSISAAGDIDWDDSVSAAITWIDMGNTTSLVGPTFSY